MPERHIHFYKRVSELSKEELNLLEKSLSKNFKKGFEHEFIDNEVLPVLYRVYNLHGELLHFLPYLNKEALGKLIFFFKTLREHVLRRKRIDMIAENYELVEEFLPHDKKLTEDEKRNLRKEFARYLNELVSRRAQVMDNVLYKLEEKFLQQNKSEEAQKVRNLRAKIAKFSLEAREKT